MSYQQLTQESIQAARQWFHDNHIACAKGALARDWFCNDPEGYAKKQELRAIEALNGSCDHTFTFWQRAYEIQTGECIGLLPK